MKALVTGASGFIGAAVATHLHNEGHDVRVLLRDTHNPDAYASRGWEPAMGDLTDPGSLRSAVAGVDTIFHVAALYTFWTRKGLDIYRVNVGGTENLLAAAQIAGIRRVVCTSSVGVLKSRGQGQPVDESCHARPDDLPDHYHRSKLLSEQAALAANGSGFEVVVVNPTTPVGEGDVKPTPTGRIILEFLARRNPGFLEGEINFVDVRDSAIGHLLAYEKGEPGQRYILGGENMTFREAYSSLSDVTGLRRRPIRIPYAAAWPVAVASEFIQGRLMGRTPLLPMQALRASRHPMFASHAKAERELGYRAVPVTGAFRRAAEWFVAHGYANLRLEPGRVAEGATR